MKAAARGFAGGRTRPGWTAVVATISGVLLAAALWAAPDVATAGAVDGAGAGAGARSNAPGLADAVAVPGGGVPAADGSGHDGGAADMWVTVPRPATPSPSATGGSPPPSPTTSSPPVPTPNQPAAPPGNGGSGNGPGGGPGTGPVDGGLDGRQTDGTCVQVEPAVPSAPAGDAWAGGVDKDYYLPGNKVTATASGFGNGERVQLVLFSDPQLIGNFTADAEGQVEAVFAVADDLPAGTHQIQFTGWCASMTALAEVLVGSPPAPAGDRGIPAWVWWLVALAVLVALIWSIRRFIRAMRERPATAEALTP